MNNTHTDIKRTTRQIGESKGLTGSVLALYMWYVDARFLDSEEDYKIEWAERFAQGREFAASDSGGRAMLVARGYCEQCGHRES